MEDIGLEELIKLNGRVVELTRLMADLDKRISKLEGKSCGKEYNERQIRQLMNEVTYLHNEVNDMKRCLGMDGSVPKIKQRKQRYS